MGYEVDTLLKSAREMDDFIHALEDRKINNCSGSAFRETRMCYYEGGILLSSHHHRDQLCSISIATNRNAKITVGCTDARAHGDPNPKVDEGELVVVWSRGEWVKTGPWIEPIKHLLATLIVRLEKAGRMKEDHDRRVREDNARSLESADRELNKAWSN